LPCPRARDQTSLNAPRRWPCGSEASADEAIQVSSGNASVSVSRHLGTSLSAGLLVLPVILFLLVLLYLVGLLVLLVLLVALLFLLFIVVLVLVLVLVLVVVLHVHL
jgi:hypothetical protein